MADEDLRGLLRAWEETGSGHAELESAFRRAGEPLPYSALAGAPRWRWLAELSRELCGEDLRPEWGFSRAEVEAAEAHEGLGRGRRFAGLLREWFLLVGKRVEENTPRHRSDVLRRLASFDSISFVGHAEGVWFWKNGSATREWVAPLDQEGDPEVGARDLHQLLVGEGDRLLLSDCLKLWLILRARRTSSDEAGPLGPQVELERAWFDARLLQLTEGRISAESWADWSGGHRPQDPVAAQREAEDILRVMTGTYEPPPINDADVELATLRLAEAKRLIEQGTRGSSAKARRHLQGVLKLFSGHALGTEAEELLGKLPPK